MHEYQQIVLFSILGTAVVTDLRSSRIPNWLALLGIGAGLVIHATQDGFSGLIFSMQGLTLGWGIFFIAFLMNGMGAGDVKLVAAVGSFLGPQSVMVAAIVIALLGGIYSIATMLMYSGVRGTIRHLVTAVGAFVVIESAQVSLEARGHQPHLRYALVIGLGTLLSQWGADIFLAHR